MIHTPLTKILVFDSGLGGLTILQALQKKLPSCEYVYASDNEAFPYGTKSAEFLITRVQRVLQVLIDKTQPHIIVVACNTASTLVLPHIRRHFAIPIVGVVPAIKPAAQQSTTKVIGLLGTPGTVARGYTKGLIEEFAKDCKVISVGSAELVILAEEALRGFTPTQAVLHSLLKPLFDAPQLDTIVLACTHFPLIKKNLSDASPREVNWIDSSEAIARRVSALLDNQALAKIGPQGNGSTAIFTAQNTDTNSLSDVLNSFSLARTEYIQV